MDKITLAHTENSPKVIMSIDERLIEFEGRSYPENTFAFYRPITEWLKKYFKYHYDESTTTTINFKLIYFNSATTQIIFEILDIVKEAKCDNIEIFWFYNKDNNNGFEDYDDYNEEFPELNIKAVSYES